MQKKLDYMIKTFEFYFDFASPYTFLAHKEIRKIEEKNLIKIKYMPVLLGGLLKFADIKANADIPIKAKYMIKDCKLIADKKNITFKFNDHFPIITLNLMRCVLVSEKNNISDVFINNTFDAIWKDGLNLNDDLVVKNLLANLNIDSKSFLEDAVDPKIKNELIKRTKEAYQKGIFGTPSFIVNKKVFWGQDRLDYAIAESSK